MIIETLVFFSFVLLILIVGFVVSTVQRVKKKSAMTAKEESGYAKGYRTKHKGYYPSGIREETTDRLTPKVLRAERNRSHSVPKKEDPAI